MHLTLHLLILTESIAVPIDRPLKLVNEVVDLCDHSLDILRLFHFLLELLVGLGQILVKFKKLIYVLGIEGVVLGPGEEGRVGLAGLVLGLCAIGEGLLHVAEGLLVPIGYLAVTLERNLEGTNHSLDAVGVGVDGLKNVILRWIYLV